MSVVENVARALVVLGGAGFLVAGFQMLTALPPVRRRVLAVSTSWPFLDPDARAARGELRNLLLRVADEDTVRADEFLEAMSTAYTTFGWAENARRSAATARRCRRWTGAVLLDIVRYPGEVARIRDYLREVTNHAELLGGYVPVESEASETVPFPDLMTALSGAVVLGDASETRARVFGHVTVVDRQRRRTPHRIDDCGAAATLKSGDYDGSVLDVRAVGRARHPTSPRFGLVLETKSSCYAETESPTGRGCKHLSTGEDRPQPTEFRFDRDVPGPDGWTAWRASEHADRTNLLTAYVLIRTSDDRLVLTQRSENVNNGLDVLSLSAGGVVEFHDGNQMSDANAAGAPDVRGAVVRECLEELGVELVDESVRAMCALQVNSCGLTSDGLPEGQVLTAVIFAGSCAMTFDEVVECQRSRSDPATGSFEVSHLEYVEFGDTPDELSAWLVDNSARIDQHLLVGISYAMLLRFGSERTGSALLSAFAESPWWKIRRGGLTQRTYFAVGELEGTPTNELLTRVCERWASPPAEDATSQCP